jgi:hypothetical protein
MHEHREVMHPSRAADGEEAVPGPGGPPRRAPRRCAWSQLRPSIGYADSGCGSERRRA